MYVTIWFVAQASNAIGVGAHVINVKMKDASMKLNVDENTTINDILLQVAKKHRLRYEQTSPHILHVITVTRASSKMHAVSATIRRVTPSPCRPRTKPGSRCVCVVYLHSICERFKLTYALCS